MPLECPGVLQTIIRRSLVPAGPSSPVLHFLLQPHPLCTPSGHFQLRVSWLLGAPGEIFFGCFVYAAPPPGIPTLFWLSRAAYSSGSSPFTQASARHGLLGVKQGLENAPHSVAVKTADRVPRSGHRGDRWVQMFLCSKPAAKGGGTATHGVAEEQGLNSEAPGTPRFL